MTTVAKHSEHPMYYLVGAPFPSSATLQYAEEEPRRWIREQLGTHRHFNMQRSKEQAKENLM